MILAETARGHSYLREKPASYRIIGPIENPQAHIRATKKLVQATARAALAADGRAFINLEELDATLAVDTAITRGSLAYESLQRVIAAYDKLDSLTIGQNPRERNAKDAHVRLRTVGYDGLDRVVRAGGVMLTTDEIRPVVGRPLEEVAPQIDASSVDTITFQTALQFDEHGEVTGYSSSTEQFCLGRTVVNEFFGAHLLTEQDLFSL